MKRLFILGLGISWWLLSVPTVLAAQPSLTFNQYMKQVMDQNETYRSNVLMTKALELREAQASLDFMPQLVGNYKYTDDRSLITELIYNGENISQSGALGVQTKLRTGTQVLFNYQMSYGTLYPASFGGTTIPIPLGGAYYMASPVLTLTQPLWKDFGASLSKANEEAQIAADRSQAALQKFSGEQVTFNAETAYWHLVLQRQIVAFDKDSMGRTNKILIWNRRRVAMNVADRSDLLQAQAAMAARQLQYQNDLQDLRTASNQFNSVRNVPGDQVTQDLQPIDSYIEKNLPAELKRIAERADVLAAQENAESQRAMARVAQEEVKPDVSAFGTAQFNGMSSGVNQATGESWNADNPIYTVGLKLTVPLDLGAVSKINEGYRATALAADLVASRARFDLDQDWNNLQKQFKDALVRLQMARELEKIQDEKLLHERNRFNAGRTTSFQVLQFEEDFSQAQLSRLRVQNELITLRAQARLYNGEIL